MQNLNVCTLQYPLAWEDKSANLQFFDQRINEITNCDLVVLPEMFPTGFSMNAAELCEPYEGEVLEYMQRWSRKTNALVIGSVITRDDTGYVNRLHAIEPEGQVHRYDKRHLFRMAKEDHTYKMGTTRVVINWKGWKILPLVCYDLRFPVWSRNKIVNGSLEYDILLYVANWPAARVLAWDTLLKARAIENLSYTIGVNRTGTDGNEIAYNGHSAVYGPKGEILYYSEKDETGYCQLSFSDLTSYRTKFPAFLDADNFTINLNND